VEPFTQVVPFTPSLCCAALLWFVPQVIFLSGWAPHSSQQQAKARGSATVSFDDLQRLAQKKDPQPA